MHLVRHLAMRHIPCTIGQVHLLVINTIKLTTGKYGFAVSHQSSCLAASLSLDIACRLERAH